MIVVVRPWNEFAATTMFARSSGMCLTRYPHLRAALMAVSTASAPVFMGSMVSVPVREVSASAYGTRSSWLKARETRVSFPTCSCAAATRRGLAWPKLTAEYPARQSR